MKIFLSAFLCLLFLYGCRNKVATQNTSHVSETEVTPSYAKGFSVFKNNDYVKIQVFTPWPGATDTLSYYLVDKTKTVPKSLTNQRIIRTPITKIISCSTVDIPLLEAIEMEHTLVGFPEHKYISSPKTRARIDQELVKDIGSLLSLNTEMILDINPEIIIGFSSNSDNKAFELLQHSGIQTLMNGSWLESHPLGRAEWIKIYGHLFHKSSQANAYFQNIETNYLNAVSLAKKAPKKPSILSGNMYKDVWYVPGGNSYAAKLINDANGEYYWQNSTDTGSLSLSFESVYDKASEADIWIGGGNFNSIQELINFEEKYGLLKAAKNNNVYSKDLKKGNTGGILYYEQGSLHADWVLLDLIKIFHPNLVPDYSFHFYQKLK